MRLVRVNKWEPQPDVTYFGAVQSAPEGDGVGLVLVQIGDGSRPCRGWDNDPADGYDGYIATFDGRPVQGRTVQYWTAKKMVAQTLTDQRGRHTVHLPPGGYDVRMLDALGTAECGTVVVAAGHRLTWESVGADGETIESVQREVCFVTEEVVCDWNTSDGQAFDWLDVLETIAKAAQKCPSLYRIAFSAFSRPDVIANLQARGVWATDTGWKDLNFAAAFRNLDALMTAGLLELRPNERANFQTGEATQWAKNRKRVEAQPGMQNYLAKARAQAIFDASTLAGQPQTSATVYDPAQDGGTAEGIFALLQRKAPLADVLGNPIPNPFGDAAANPWGI